MKSSSLRMSNVDLVFFTKTLAIMFRAAIPVEEIFTAIADQMSGQGRKISHALSQEVSSGISLHEALSRFPRAFPVLYVNLVKAGEASGTLSENLDLLATQMERDYETRRKIVSALIYPALIFGAAIVLALGIAYFVLPRILPIFVDLGVQLPWMTKALLAVSTFLQLHIIGTLIALVGVCAGTMLLLRTAAAQRIVHPLVLWVPVVGKVARAFALTQATRSLYTLVKSGTTIDESMLIAKDVVGNVVYKKDLSTALGMVEGGGKIGASLESISGRRWPKIATSMIRAGEESGKLEESLLYLADYYDAEIDEAVKRATTLLEPLLILFIGLFVGGIALSILTPIYSLTSSLR